MAKNSLISIGVFIFFLLITVSIFLCSTDRSQFPSFSLPLSYSSPCPPPSNLPLKVFMYDLPPRFNVEMLSKSRNPNPNPSYGGMPPWPAGSGIKLQHSVEYWMMASLMGSGAEEEGEAIRVFDAAKADAFFVPFFSSLSFNTHGKNMTDPDTEIDRQLQIDLLDFLRKSEYWQQSAGRDHVIPMHHPNAFRFLRDQVNASILIVADFGRYPRSLSSLSKDMVAPYVHVVDSFADDNTLDPFGSRPTLLFFRGRTVRKDEGIIRAKLAKLLRGYDDVRFEDSFATGEGIKASSQGMRSSKFCLHPAGDTPSSNRLFDAIVSHCVPVIVSDHIELPFEVELDYSDFSLFFSVRDALQPDYLVSKLREISKEQWLVMWTRLKNVSHYFEFQYPPKREDAVNMLWCQVRHKLPSARLAVHRNRRLRIPDWWNRQ